jgi:dCTP deaminase
MRQAHTEHTKQPMTLSDSQLHTLCQCRQLVHPYYPENVGPCSIDLTLGAVIRPEGVGDRPFTEEVNMYVEGAYVLHPGERVLATTQEVISMPLDKVGKLMLRSTAARLGLEHSFSGLIDPFFEGQLTLELKNDLQTHTISLMPGMRLIQMSVETVIGKVEKGYDKVGWYQGQAGPTVSNYRTRSEHKPRKEAVRSWKY